MPYLVEDEKNLLDAGSEPQTCGHLTYLIYRAALDNDSLDLCSVLRDAVNRFLPKEPKFEDYAKVLGSIYAAGLELERRYTRGPLRTAPIALYAFAADFYHETVGPYEDIKIQENGDVL